MANSIKMEIELDGDDALRTLAAIQKGMKRTETSTGKAAEKASVFADVFKANIGTLVAVNFGDFIARQVGEAFDAFVKFEKGLIDTAKTTGLTNKEMSELADNIADMALDIPASTQELLEITTAAGQLGVKGTKDLTKFADTISKLGRVANISGDEAATQLTRILTVTREGVTDIDLFASGIVALGNDFAANEAEIIHFTAQVARAGGQFKVSSGEAAALATTMKALSISSEEGGTVISKTFLAIQAAIDGGGKSLEKLSKITGIAGEDLKKQFGDDALSVFQKFVGGLQKFDNISAALASVGLTGARVNKTLPVLSENMDNLSRALTTFKEGAKNASALNEEFARSLESTDAQLQLLDNALEKIKRSFGRSFADAAKAIAPAIVSVIDAFNTSPMSKVIREATNDTVELKRILESLKGRGGPLIEGFSNDVILNIGDAEKGIALVNERLLELEQIKVGENIKAVTAELEKIKSEGLDPILLNSIYGSEEAHAAKQEQVQAQLDNLLNMQALHDGTLAEMAAAKRQLELDNMIEQFSVLNELNATEKDLKIEADTADTELDLESLKRILGEKEAIREVARIMELAGEDKQKAALEKLRGKARKKEAAAQKAALKAQQELDRMAAEQAIGLVSNTGNAINAIAGKQTKAGFILGKVAAAANVLVQDGAARAAATTAAAGAAALTGPAAPAVFSLTLAQMQAVITANTALSLGAIAASTIGGFASGGGVFTGPSQVNDRLLANVNAGESILTKRQSNKLFDGIENGGVGGGDTVVNISNPILLNQEGIDTVIDEINDAIEFRNKELRTA